MTHQTSLQSTHFSPFFLAATLACLPAVACGGGDDPSDEGGDGDGVEMGGDGDALAGDGDGDVMGSDGDGDLPIDVGVFDGLSGWSSKLALTSRQACALDAGGVMNCPDISSFWSGPPTVALEKVAGDFDVICGLDAMGEMHCTYDDNFPGTRPGPFTALGVGDEVICGLRPNGTIECWGENEDVGNPSDEYRFVDVALSYSHACAIMTEGDVACWGRSSEYLPGNFVKISLYQSSVCALSESGDISCSDESDLDELPPGPYQDMAVGSGFVCGIFESGEVVCNGSSPLARLAPPAGTWDQIEVEDRDACVWRDDGAMECWGMTLGDGASTHMCEDNQTLLSGTLSGGAFSGDFSSRRATDGFGDVTGFRFAHQLHQDAPETYGLLVLDGPEDYGSYDRENLPPMQSVDVSSVMLFMAPSFDDPGEFYCSSGGSTVELISDEVMVDLQNLHLLGGCNSGTPVSGEIGFHTVDEPTVIGIDGANFEPGSGGGSSGGYNPDGNSGTTWSMLGDGGVIKLDWGAEAALNFAVYVSAADSPLGGAVYCTTTGTVDRSTGSIHATLTNWNKIDPCPADSSSDSLSGCLR